MATAKSEEARRIEEEAIQSVTPEKRKQLEALLVKNSEYKPEKIGERRMQRILWARRVPLPSPRPARVAPAPLARAPSRCC